MNDPVLTFAIYFKQKNQTKMKKITIAALALMFIGSVAIGQEKKAEKKEMKADKKEMKAEKAGKKSEAKKTEKVEKKEMKAEKKEMKTEKKAK